MMKKRPRMAWPIWINAAENVMIARPVCAQDLAGAQREG
jgi:hypothetical protein